MFKFSKYYASWSVRIFQRRLCFLVCSDFPKKIMLPPLSLVVKIKSTRKERPVNAKSSSEETDEKCDKVNMEEEKNTATVESERKLSSGLRRRFPGKENKKLVIIFRVGNLEPKRETKQRRNRCSWH